MAGLLDLLRLNAGGPGLMGDQPVAPPMALQGATPPDQNWQFGGLLGLLQGGGSPERMQNFQNTLLALSGNERMAIANQQNQMTQQFLRAMMEAGPEAANLIRGQSVPSQAPTSGGGPFANAISGIESGGNYEALGPTTKTGDRAYGKYQIMGENLGPWTKEVLGQEMTPEQFLKNPQAQDAVFQAKFGQYVQKYGPENAAKAWFAGEQGMNNPNARDQLGTTVAGYAQKFAQVMPAGTPVAPPAAASVQAQIDKIQEFLMSKKAQAIALANPNAPMLKALQQRVQDLQKSIEPTGGMREAASEGRTVTQQEVAKKQAIIPAETRLASEKGFAEAYAKGQGEDALALERSADNTMAERQRMEVFKNLVADFKTGKLAPGQATAGAWMDALGIDPKKFGINPNAAVNGQLIESLSNQMTLGMIGTKGGEQGMPANNFSDADRKFLANTAPGLARMQGGNLVLLEMKSRGLDRQLEKVNMWDQYNAAGKPFSEFQRDWRKYVNSQPALFGDIPQMIKSLSQPGGAVVTTQAQTAPAIPAPAQRVAGQVYTTPKGPARWMGNGWQLVQ